ncbi:MAG: hypothetical protein KC636_24050 [Myxococcales bacterium]|nr:hypothetical protein [Myxococcales bacterium]
MDSRRLRLAPAALLALAACGEQPSFELRWAIKDPSGDAPLLASALQCSEVGIARVQVTAYQGGVPVTLPRDFPCFPPDFTDPEARAPGPELPEGTYEIEVVPLSRLGRTWTAVNPVTRTIEVINKDAIPIDDIVFPIPPQCLDGVDNDGDGQVDRADPSCAAGAGREDATTAGTRFTVRASLLGDLPEATCAGVGIFSLQLTIDGVVDDELLACKTNITQQFTRTLAGGPHVAALVGLGAGGQPVTDAVETEFTILEDEVNIIPLTAAFDYGDLLAPPQGILSLGLAYPAAGEDDVPMDLCFSASDLVIDTVEVTVLEDLGGGLTAIDPPVVPVESGEFFDGTAMACPAFLRSEPFAWDAPTYVAVNAYVDTGDTLELCFTNVGAPTQAAPGADITVLVPRVPGPISKACGECTQDADCPLCDPLQATDTGCCVFPEVDGVPSEGGICRNPSLL